MRYAFLAAVLLTLVPCSYGFDGSDAGEYKMLRVDGKPIALGFRIFQASGRWVFEQETKPGVFVERPCTGPCEFTRSTPESVQNMFRNGELNRLRDMSCIENKAFALCSFTAPPHTAKGYVIVLLREEGPVPVALRQVRRVVVREQGK